MQWNSRGPFYAQIYVQWGFQGPPKVPPGFHQGFPRVLPGSPQSPPRVPPLSASLRLFIRVWACLRLFCHVWASLQLFSPAWRYKKAICQNPCSFIQGGERGGRFSYTGLAINHGKFYDVTAICGHVKLRNLIMLFRKP